MLILITPTLHPHGHRHGHGHGHGHIVYTDTDTDTNTENMAPDQYPVLGTFERVWERNRGEECGGSREAPRRGGTDIILVGYRDCPVYLHDYMDK